MGGQSEQESDVVGQRAVGEKKRARGNRVGGTGTCQVFRTGLIYGFLQKKQFEQLCSGAVRRYSVPSVFDFSSA